MTNEDKYEQLCLILNEDRNQKLISLQKDFMIAFYREHKDLDVAQELSIEAIVRLSQLPDLTGYPYYKGE